MTVFFVEQIKELPDGKIVSSIDSYADELTANTFYHSNLNICLRMIPSGDLKSYYTNIHNSSGVKLKEERWEIGEE